MPDVMTAPTFNPSETYTLTAAGSVVRGSDGAYIPEDEANADWRAFLAWQASGKTATPYMPPPVDLVAYANAHQWSLACGGFEATIAGAKHRFATDPTSLGLITGKAVRLQQPNAPASVGWQFDADGLVTIAATDFIAVATAVADFVQSTFDALAAVLAGIKSGEITTAEQIDAYAWPPA